MVKPERLTLEIDLFPDESAADPTGIKEALISLRILINNTLASVDHVALKINGAEQDWTAKR